VTEKRSLRLREEAVTVEAEDGHERRFTIRELDGAGRAIAVEATRERLVVNGEHVTVRDAGGLALVVLGLALRDESGNLLAKDVLAKWPGSLVDEWARIASRISRLPMASEGND